MAIGDPFYQPPVLQPMFMPDESYNPTPPALLNRRAVDGGLYAAMRNNPAVVPLGNPEDDFLMAPTGVTQNVSAPALSLVNSAQASAPAPAMAVDGGLYAAMRNNSPDNQNQPTADQFSTPAMNNTPPPALGRSQVNAPQSRGALVSTPDRGRRSNTMLSVERPDLGIGTNEMLMRVGGAGLANAGQGGLAAYGAMFDQYGNIQDQRRTNALAEYEADYRAEQDELARQDALKIAELEAQSKNAPDADTQQQIGQIDQTIFDMDRALANLEGGMQLTGFFDATFGAAWDNITGNPQAAGRLLLQKLKVDDTLLRVAQTKGAISNKEMDLFMSPAPSKYADEKVWIKWIKDRKQAIQKVKARLSGNQTLDQNQQATTSQINSFSSSNPQNLSAADAIVGL